MTTELEFDTIIEIPNDATHRGASDWYKEAEQQILAALAKGKDHRWEMPWAGCKHEILSTHIVSSGGWITASVSMSNDFDTTGMGSETIPWSPDPLKLKLALGAALRKAEKDQLGNETVIMYVVGLRDSLHRKDRKRTGRRHGDRKNWVFTFLVNLDTFGIESESPPGDYYHNWGWQDLEEGEVHPREIPAKLARKLEVYMLKGRYSAASAGRWVAETDHWKRLGEEEASA